jgi:hypothetical protein
MGCDQDPRIVTLPMSNLLCDQPSAFSRNSLAYSLRSVKPDLKLWGVLSPCLASLSGLFEFCSWWTQSVHLVDLKLSWPLFFFGMGFELRALCLQTGRSTAWATPPVHFAVILEMRVSWTISLSWPRTEIFPISAFQLARMTGVSWTILYPLQLFSAGFPSGLSALQAISLLSLDAP